VKLPRDAQFEAERVKYALRFECEDCTYFAPTTRDCVHGYPTLEHRAQTDESGCRLVVFCKEFETA